MKQNVRFLALALAAALFALAVPADAATRVKANNTDDLNLTTSWTNGVVPGSADTALFDATITTPLTVALGGDMTWRRMTIADPAGDPTIGGANTLTLNDDNTAIDFGTSTVNPTFNCDMSLSGVD